MSKRFHEEYNRFRMDHWKLFPGIESHLETLALEKKQSILSAAAQWHLDDWVKHFNIAQHFDHVFGVADHYATSKVDRGKELVTVSQISPEETILIGDTDHDLEVAHALGVNVLILCDGHQSFNRLSALHPNVLKTRF